MTRRHLLSLPAVWAASRPAIAQSGKRTSPSFEAIAQRLQSWAKQYPRIVTLSVEGKSTLGEPLFAVRMTDSAADDSLKEHALLTALHAGQEHSGATSCLRIMEWLLSGDAAAREVLKRQVLVWIPVANPDLYKDPDRTDGLANWVGQDPYTGWTVDGPRDPVKNPEAAAVQKVMDQLQADIHGDLHGNSLPYPGVFQIESSGRAYSNVTLRPYHHEIVRLMDKAALAGGYPSDEQEEDAERLFGLTDMGIPREKLWAGLQTPAGGASVISKPRVYAAVYGYNRYHTMPIATECAWEESALLRYRALLQVGNEVWPGEYYSGYPVRVVMKNGYDLVVAYGVTAEARRHSRIELWNRQLTIRYGGNRPLAPGKVLFACATSPAAEVRWLSDRTLRGFAAKMKEHPQMQADRIGRIVEGFPTGPGQWGQESNLMLDGGAMKGETTPIQHGLCFRLRIPFPKAQKFDIWMNGQPLSRSEINGYITWVGRGFLNVQINIPPESSRTNDFYVITCEYDPGERRSSVRLPQ